MNKLRLVLWLIVFTLLFNTSISAGENIIKDNGLDCPFGVLEFLPWNHSWNKYRYPDRKSLEKVAFLMRQAGVRWVRMDFVWQDIEPKENRFDFEKYDMIVDVLSRQHINILGLFNYNTDWSSSCGDWNCPPKDNLTFVNYAVKTIRRYKSRIKYWEVWNEPDSVTYWKNQDGLKSYCVLLKDVYKAAKKEDPDCKILNGGFANAVLSTNKLYDNGAKDYFDILNIHIFESPVNSSLEKKVLTYAKLVYKIMKRNGDADKKIWVTEIGCPGVKAGIKTGNWWMGQNPTEKQQAELTKIAYTQLIQAPGVEKVFWAFFRDTKEFWNTGVDYFGLVRFDYSKKPSFITYKKCFKNWEKQK